jgi:UDP-N-acetylglucosamine--N-acetylmuramyl-(pentapeptide) pyrophosphoryl-undecaprenol N-acetylglucosamine transferase
VSALERVMIAGGGTGGHVYPGVAVAEEVLARNPAAEVCFVGAAHGMEAKILPRLGYRLETITVSRLKGGSLKDRLLGIGRLPVGIAQSWRLLRRYDPQVVLGVGGYASGPALIASWLTRRPRAVQEQNAIPGLTNRVLGRLSHRVLMGFAKAAEGFPEAKVRVTGNPLRRAVSEALAGKSNRPATSQGRLRLLVFGGSQGARFLNENVPEAIATARGRQAGLSLSVVHQTGPADESATRDRYARHSLGELVKVTPYIDDMPAAYAQADLAICRAGALTLAEIAAVGLPSLLVPFPFAADNHQEANARVLEEAGAARAMPQHDWRTEEVAGWVVALANDPARVEAMSRAARGLARLDAAARVVDALEEIAR